ncbi:GLPGLI family protein [Chryseobacterium sp. POL2]|uniref:GLPGLI family protein n=1 Tax=Chryseobacterium sp. POL2 TaxID=2713414 RepID=UPI0013E116AF|nr:GLPGLI family protein [Chryseobacterium sp. POL2]QIG88420.1 GLPGLI family protein [Chryseobacterium sp. POL2]
MKKLLLGFSVIGQFAFAQDYHITYNFRFKEDSLSSNYTNKNYVLQVEKDKTKFILKDLISNNKILESNTKMFYNLPMEQVVSHPRNTDDYINYNVIFQNYYSYPSNDPIVWEIKNDTKEENTYKLQKAITRFGGRQWEAWFIPEIPIMEGPFKFRALPGLIYEVKDNNDNFAYELIEVKKLDTTYDTSNIIETHFGIKPIAITRKKFVQLIVDGYKNPYSEYRSMKPGTWSINPDQNRKIDNIKDLDIYAKEVQEQTRKKNNPVELSKAIHFPLK